MFKPLQTDKENLLSNLTSLPKAELHIHLEGAARWSTIRQLFYQHKGLILPEQPAFYNPDFRFTHFSQFLECFQRYIHPWLKTPSGYAELIDDVIASLIEQNVRYVELNCNLPYVERFGASLEQVLWLLENAVERAVQQSGMVIRIIAGIPRHEGVENAKIWIQRLVQQPIISGFDLHGLETGWSAELFRDAIAPAREAGKKIKAHAGELEGAESIRIAIEKLGVNQIGHGTSAIQDPEIVDLLIARNVLLEMCPTSNERLRVVTSYGKHPILKLDAAGVAVTLNSDDPSFFGVNLTGEITRMIVERDICCETIVRWTQNAFQRAMLDQQTHLKFEAELNHWLQAQSS